MPVADRGGVFPYPTPQSTAVVGLFLLPWCATLLDDDDVVEFFGASFAERT
jgi:hypothetical protein